MESALSVGANYFFGQENTEISMGVLIIQDVVILVKE